MCSSVRVSVLLALVALLHLGDATVEKFSECCKSTSVARIPGKVTGILPQKKNGQCVRAYIVQMDDKYLFCVHPGARWVQPHARDYLEKLKAKTQTPPTQRSLLSMLTDSPSSSSFISSSAPPPSPTSSFFSSDLSSAAEEISSGEIEDMN